MFRVLRRQCVQIKKREKTIGVIPATTNRLYRVDHAEMAASATEAVSLLTFHRRLGHISADSIRMLIRQGAVRTHATLTDDATLLSCDSCEYAKTGATRKPINKERVAPPADAFGAEVHSDVSGAPLSQ